MTNGESSINEFGGSIISRKTLKRGVWVTLPVAEPFEAAIGSELRERGFDTRLIADMPWQRRETMALHYSRGADLQEKLKAAIEKMKNADKARTELSGNSGKAVESPEAPLGASVSSH